MASNFTRRSALAAGLTISAMAACGGEQPPPQTAALTGGCQTIFDGNVCTWGTSVDGKVTEFGATLPLATVQNAPMGGDMVFPPVPVAVIALPPEVVEATGFDHFGVY